MNHTYNLLLSVITALFTVCSAYAQVTSPHQNTRQGQLVPTEGAISPIYIANRGQWDTRARFLARWNGLDMWVGADGITYDLYRLTEPKAERTRSAAGLQIREPHEERPARDGHVVRMRFVGADPGAEVIGTNRLPGVHNYFLGSDPGHWAANVPLYGGARIVNLYQGIDAVLYTDRNLPRYDLVVAPGAAPSAVSIRYEGARGVRVDRRGNLVIATSMGDLRQQELFAYQMVEGGRQRVRCAFRTLPDGNIGFALGAYDRSRPLVIDPVVYSTLIAPDGYARGFDVALDRTDNAYLTGYTGSASYPTSLGAYRGSRNGEGIDAYVTKISNDGRSLAYSTYLGGTSDEVGLGITVDAGGMVYVVGYSYSDDFPMKNAADSTFGGRYDAFVAKLDPNQDLPAQHLVYSTYLGGTTGDFAAEVAARSGQAYVVGYTDSPDFNIVNAYQPLPVRVGSNPPGEAFVSRLSSNGATLIGSTYVGGDSADIGRGIALDARGNVWITGTTYSGTFPTDGVMRAYDSTHDHGADAFVARLSAGLDTLLYGTYLGGDTTDAPSGIALDDSGNVFITGSTAGDFPTTEGAFQERYNGGFSDMFITKFTPDGDSLIFSTYVGGNNDDYSNAIAVDARGNAWVAGMSVGGTFPFTQNAIQPFRNGTTFDIAIAGVNPTGDRQLFGSFYGGTGGDSARAVAVASDGTLVLTGSTYSGNFPTTVGSYRPNAPLGTYLLRLGIMNLIEPKEGGIYCGGEFVDISWGGSANASYDIYVSADSGKTFVPVAFSITGRSYTWFIPQAQAAGDRYLLKVTTSTGTEADLSGMFTIYTPPRITSQPYNMSTIPGGTVSFVAAADANPAATVQWQRKEGTKWVDLPNMTTPTLRLVNVTPEMNGTQYRAVFTNRCRSVFSDSVLLTVSSIALTGPTGGETFCSGDTITIGWEARANTGGVNISISSDGGQSWMPIASNVTKQPYRWKIPASYAGTNYRVRVELADVLTSDASASGFTVNTRARITKDPQNVDGYRGSSATFTAEGTGAPLPSILWQVEDGNGWRNLPGANSPTLALTGLTLEQNGYRYRAITTNACGSDTSEAALLRVSVEGEGGVEEDRAAALALGMRITPNPAHAGATLTFTLPRTGRTRILLRDLRGTVVADVADAVMEAGTHDVPMELAGLPAGTYIAELATGSLRAAVKVTVVR